MTRIFNFKKMLLRHSVSVMIGKKTSTIHQYYIMAYRFKAIPVFQSQAGIDGDWVSSISDTAFMFAKPRPSCIIWDGIISRCL